MRRLLFGIVVILLVAWPASAQTTTFRFPKVVFTSTAADAVRSYGGLALHTAGVDGADGVGIYFTNTAYPTTYRHKVSASVAADTALGYLKFSLATGASTFIDVLTLRETGRVGVGTTAPQEWVQVLKDSTPTEGAMGVSILSAASDTELGFGASAASDYAWVQAFQDATSWTTRPLKVQPNGGVTVIGGDLRRMVDGAETQASLVGATTLTDATATALVTVAMADAARTGGELSYTVEVTDAGADNDVYTSAIRFAAQRKGAAVSCDIGAIGSPTVTKSHAGAALAVTATCDATSGTSIVLKLNADTALTAITFKAHWHLRMLKGHGGIS